MRKPICKRVNRLKNRIRDFYGKFFPLDPTEVSARIQQKKLVMTLLVRDEVDVIKRNIEYHLRHGVDFIIATDNCSKDGTLEVLREYESAGRLHLIQETGLNYEQAKWVNRMGRIAQESYRADIIFHCDADEFWVAESGNLKSELIRRSSTDCLKVPIYHSTLIDRGGSEHFPADTIYFKNPDIRLLGGEWREFPSACKVMFKVHCKPPEVDMGNHALIDRYEKISTRVSTDIRIFHFGVRSREHFCRKVRNGGAAVEANSSFNTQIASHWRDWYRMDKAGLLETEYKKNKMNERELIKREQTAEFVYMSTDVLFNGLDV